MLKKFIIILLSIFIPTVASAHNNMQSTTMELHVNENMGVNYSVIFLNVTNEKMYQEYRKSIRPIFKKVGGILEREFKVTAVRAVEGELDVGPINRILIMYYSTPEGGRNLVQTDEYKANRPKMDAAIDNFFLLSGKSMLSHNSQIPVDERRYIMKLAAFQATDDRHARNVERLKVVKEMAKINYNSERWIDVSFNTQPIKIDQISLSYWSSKKDSQKLSTPEYKGLLDSILDYNRKYLGDVMYFTLTPVKSPS